MEEDSLVKKIFVFLLFLPEITKGMLLAITALLQEKRSHYFRFHQLYIRVVKIKFK